MVLMMAILRGYFLGVLCDIMMVKCLALTKSSNCDLLMVNCLALYLEMYMESHSGSVLEQIWTL